MKETLILIKQLRKRFCNFRITQEREILAKYFGEKNKGDLVPFFLEANSSFYQIHGFFGFFF